MTPSAVLIKLTSTTTNMNNEHITIITKNALSLSKRINGPTSSHFGVYQQTKIGSIEVSIRTHFPISISTVPSRKLMIAKICFRKILTLSASSSVYSSDFTTTVASYFGINTESAKREAEVAVTSIRKDVFEFLICSALD